MHVSFSKARSECRFSSQWQVGSCKYIFHTAVKDASRFFFLLRNVLGYLGTPPPKDPGS